MKRQEVGSSSVATVILVVLTVQIFTVTVLFKVMYFY
jgi:hypothetical protein